MLSTFYYLKFKTDVLQVIYTVLTNILTYVEIGIPTWYYFSTYPKDTLTKYIS